MVLKTIKIPEELHSKLWRIKSRVCLDSGKNIHLHEIIDLALKQSSFGRDL